MHPLIEENRTAIEALCQEFGIEKLEVFGSIVTNAFDDESDVDFIVHLPDGFDYGPWGSRFFSIEERLSDMLGRDVDVLSSTSVARKNIYFRRQADATRRAIFDASQIGITA
ncbi:MAG TPA: nucleotidyltransferase domain-containing protein [Thermomicrobiales bacterium]|nr:nucleotidyltransferase domain-containing protein [Thermomicrobiales bacterium]